MSKLTIYLLLLVIGVTFITAERVDLHIETPIPFKTNGLFKGLEIVLILSLGLYFLFSYLNENKVHPMHKFYAQKITNQEYENQKTLYTQIKLSELYKSLEYKQLSQKKLNQPYMPYEEIRFSDEDT